jgi:hypothetical protein
MNWMRRLTPKISGVRYDCNCPNTAPARAPRAALRAKATSL